MNTSVNDHDQTVARNVMKRIQSGTVTMRPRWQFTVLAILGVTGLVAVTILMIYLVNLVIFKLRLAASDHPMNGLRSNLSYYTGHFPWLACGIAIVSAILFIWLLRKFDFSYRAGRWLAAVVVTLSLLVGTALAFTNLNNHLETFGPMRGIYGQPANNHGPSNTPRQQNSTHNQSHSPPSNQK